MDCFARVEFSKEHQLAQLFNYPLSEMDSGMHLYLHNMFSLQEELLELRSAPESLKKPACLSEEFFKYVVSYLFCII